MVTRLGLPPSPHPTGAGLGLPGLALPLPGLGGLPGLAPAPAPGAAGEKEDSIGTYKGTVKSEGLRWRWFLNSDGNILYVFCESGKSSPNK